MHIKPMGAGAALATLALSIGVASIPAGAQDFYKGKTVNIIVGFSPGGGYDTYARTVARFLNKHIPGTPSIVVQNMPGAASLKSVLYVANAGPKDGTAIGAFNPGVITDSLLNADKVKIKMNSVAYLGSITNDFRVCYSWHTSKVKSWDDLAKGTKYILGSTGKGASSYVNGAILRNVFKFNVQQVLGYPGSAEQRIAIERGELDGDCGSWSSISEEWIRDKKIHPLVQFTSRRTPDMPPDIPFIGDKADPQQKQVLNILLAAGALGRPYIMAKEVPKDRLATMQKAFMATMNDAGFLAEAKKQSLPVNPVDGAEAAKIIDEIYAAPADIVALAKKAVE
ncbi:MAG: hypothetical protein RLZ98_2120 [Pseudomonadota bacterium]|jgi:tripartite-type tricarboxylate transporter receptor subunit TctC